MDSLLHIDGKAGPDSDQRAQVVEEVSITGSTLIGTNKGWLKGDNDDG